MAVLINIFLVYHEALG